MEVTIMTKYTIHEIMKLMSIMLCVCVSGSVSILVMAADPNPEREARLEELRAKTRNLTPEQRGLAAEVLQRVQHLSPAERTQALRTIQDEELKKAQELEKLSQGEDPLPREVSEQAVAYIGGAEQFPHLLQAINSPMQTLGINYQTHYAGKAQGLKFDLDNNHIISGDRGGKVKIWNLLTGTSRVISSESSVYAMDYNPVVQYVGAGYIDGSIRIWDVRTGVLVKQLSDSSKQVNGLKFSSNGTRIMSGHTDGTIQVWNISTGELVQKLLDQDHNPILSIDCSPDSLYVVAGYQNGKIKIWNISAGSIERECKGPLSGSVFIVIYSIDGNQIASGAKDGKVKIWDAHTGKSVKVLPGPRESVSALSYSPDGEFLVAGFQDNDGTIHTWEVSSKDPLVKTLRFGSQVYTIAYSSDGKCIAASGEDGIIKIWNSCEKAYYALHHLSIKEYLIVKKINNALANRDALITPENPRGLVSLTSRELAELNENPNLRKALWPFILELNER